MACCAGGDTFVSPSLKYSLFFFNFMLWLIGSVMIGIGCWAFLEKNKYYEQNIETIYDVLLDLSILLIIVGAVIFVIGFAGCVGALRENILFIKIFYVMILLIVLAEIGAAVMVFVFKDRAQDEVKDILKEGMIIRYQDDEDGVFDWFQEKLQCCGINGYRDWNKNMYFNCTKENPSGLRCSVPYSCCREPDALNPGIANILCGADALNETLLFKATAKIFTIGCVESFVHLAESNLPIIGGIVIGLGVPQLLGICLGRLLEGQIKDQMIRYTRH